MNKTILVLSTVIGLFLYSCKNKPQNPSSGGVVENEVITTYQWTLTDSANMNNKVQFSYRDLTPNDNNAGVFVVGDLEPNKTYLGTIVLLDETKNPVDTVSKEILELADEHQFQFQSSNSKVTVSYIDSGDDDSYGLPLGLQQKIKVGNIAGEKVNLSATLYHIPHNKSMDYLYNAANGSIDLQVNFYDVNILNPAK